MVDADMPFIFDEEDELEDELDDMLLDEHSQLFSQRFLERCEYRNEPTKWGKELYDENLMKDHEFLAEYLWRPYFLTMLELIKDDPVFLSKNITKPFKAGPELNLVALFRYIRARYGNQNYVLK
jgi:hypothetical protein